MWQQRPRKFITSTQSTHTRKKMKCEQNINSKYPLSNHINIQTETEAKQLK